MANIEKHSTDSIKFIKHNCRELPPGKCPSNQEIDRSKTPDNYSLINRGKSAREINNYRKQLEKELFKYNRKNLVHSVEVIMTLPLDCPHAQEYDFFIESYKFLCSTLPMGERCVFQAQVHMDEGGQPHLHVMYVPAVHDHKHSGYQFKLCADELTKRSRLKEFHPKYQKWLNDAGIQATVHSGTTSGKNLSVSTIKTLTQKFNITLDDIKNLSHTKEVISELTKQNIHLKEKVSSLEKELSNHRSHNHEGIWKNINGWGKEHNHEKEF